MGGADRFRAEHVPLDIEPERGQTTEDMSESVSNKSRHVLTNDPSGSNFPNDALDVGPEPALVFDAELLTGRAERLTGEAGRNEVNHSRKGRRIELVDRADEYRRWIQGLFFHPIQEGGCSVAFPFDVAHTAKPREQEPEAELESSDSGAQREASEDGTTHMHYFRLRGRRVTSGGGRKSSCSIVGTALRARGTWKSR